MTNRGPRMQAGRGVCHGRAACTPQHRAGHRPDTAPGPRRPARSHHRLSARAGRRVRAAGAASHGSADHADRECQHRAERGAKLASQGRAPDLAAPGCLFQRPQRLCVQGPVVLHVAQSGHLSAFWLDHAARLRADPEMSPLCRQENGRPFREPRTLDEVPAQWRCPADSHSVQNDARRPHDTPGILDATS